MSKKRIVFASAMLLLLLAVPAGMASSETTVSYHVATDDVFPALTDISASVILECSAVFNSSDGTVLPNNSTKYLITARPGSGTLTVDYTINRHLLKKSGSPSVSIDPTWLLGDSPPIKVYEDAVIRITVVIHGNLNGQVAIIGNGSATPSSVTWSTWQTIDISVSANTNAQNGQTIQVQTATKYVVYFTVTVELIGIEAFTRDSQTREVSGSPPVQSNISVVPELSSWQLLLLTFLTLSIVMIISNRKSRLRRERDLSSNLVNLERRHTDRSHSKPPSGLLGYSKIDRSIEILGMADSVPDLEKRLIPSAIAGSRFRLLFAVGDLLEVRVLSNSLLTTSTAILAFLSFSKSGHTEKRR